MENIKSPSNINEEELYFGWYEKQDKKKEEEIRQMEQQAAEEWPDE
jgi:hypothetical protein